MAPHFTARSGFSCGIVHAQYMLAINLYVAFNFLPISENAKSFYAGGGEEGCGIHACIRDYYGNGL